ncbi:MAG TPA: hypothetical protein VIH96_19965 [Paraburkholderia sp.]
MATPFLVVVAANFREVLASSRSCVRRAPSKACWKSLKPTTMRDDGALRAAKGFPSGSRNKFSAWL